VLRRLGSGQLCTCCTTNDAPVRVSKTLNRTLAFSRGLLGSWLLYVTRYFSQGLKSRSHTWAAGERFSHSSGTSKFGSRRNMDITAFVSNHRTLRRLVAHGDHQASRQS